MNDTLSGAAARSARSATAGLLAGVDIGGTTIAVRLADERLVSVGRSVVETVRDQPDRAGRQVVDAVATACAEAGVALERVMAVGIGVPGQVDPAAGTVSTAVNLGWEHVRLAADVTAVLGVPCALDNDVRAAAEGVRAQRILGDARDFIYVSVGTGIAAGIVVDDQVLHGAHQFSGEIGHLVVEPDGPACACGQHGCLEAIASGPAVAGYARSLIDSGAASSLRNLEPLTAAHVYAASLTGDQAARAAVTRGARAMARAFHLLGAILDIPIIAIGGGVTAAGPAFFDPLEQALDVVRAGSGFAAAVLPRDLVRPLPAGYEPGTWGAVLLARKGRTSLGVRGQPRKEVGTSSTLADPTD